MNNKINSLRQTYKRHGANGVLMYTARILFYRRKNSTRIFLYMLTTPKPSEKSILAADGHEFRFATLQDLESLHCDPKWEIENIHLKAHKKGDQCLLQIHNTKVVGYTWIISTPLIEIMWGFHFNMPDDTVYNYKGYTTPEYRGKGFQPLRHLKILEYIHKQGQNRLFAYVDHLNMSSQQGVKKSGYVKIGVLHCKRQGDNIIFKLKVKKDAWSVQRRN